MSILEAFLAGKEARRHADAAEQVNALQQFVGQNGQAIMGGDPNALGQLAGFGVDGLNMAMGVQENVYNRKRQETADARATKVDARGDQEWQLKLEEYAASKTAAEREAEAAKIEDAVKAGLMTKTPQEWDALATSMGATDLVGQFANREALAARAMTMAEVLKATQAPSEADAIKLEKERIELDRLKNPVKEPLSKEGKLAADIASGFVAEGTTATPETVVQMGGDKFADAFATGDATTIETVYNAGLAAQRNLGRIDQLSGLLDASPTGFGASIASAAGEWGINTEGLDDLQAAQALINSLVPEQRQPGSGPMSDADLALFKQSLPRLINQPGGNKVILDTMRGIAEYDAEGARIVQRLRNGELTRAEAFDALQTRANPLDKIKTNGGGEPPSITSDDEYDALPPGTVFIDPEGNKRTKP